MDRSESSNPVASGPTSTTTTTTTDLVKDVPTEDQRRRSVMPGDFPMTPAQDIDEFIGHSIPSSSQPKPLDGSRSAAPTPADDADDADRRDRDEPRFGVNPLPATAGMDNPIHLRPGERVPDPSNFTKSTVLSNVTRDRESYERSGSTPFLPPVVTPQEERMRKGTGVLDLPPITKDLIPESSLPIAPGPDHDTDSGPNISSVAPRSSTVGLASRVPLEPRRHDPAGARPSDDAENVRRTDPDPIISSVAPESSSVPLASPVPVEPRQDASRTPRAHRLGSDTDPGANLLSSVAPESSTVKLASKVPLEPREGASSIPAGHDAGGSNHHGPSISSVAPDASTVGLASDVPLEPRQGSFVTLPPDRGPGTWNDRGPSLSSVGPTSSTVALASAVPIQSRPDSARLSKARGPPDDDDDVSQGRRPATSSTAPESSVVALASDAPLESREPTSVVPRLVEESQPKAHVDSEPSPSSEAVAEKHAVERELGRRVHELPPTSEGVAGDPTRPISNPPASAADPFQSTSTHALSLVGPSSAGVQVLPGSFPGSGGGHDRGADDPVVSGSMAPRDRGGADITSGGGSTRPSPASTSRTVPAMNPAAVPAAVAGVPDVVVRSLRQAHRAPEAAANREAVMEKRQVERELLDDVRPVQTVGDPASTRAAASSEFAPGPTPERMPSSTADDDARSPSSPSPVERHDRSSGARSSVVSSGPSTRALAASATSPATTPSTRSAAHVPARTLNDDDGPVFTESAPGPTVTTAVDKTTTEQVTSHSTPQKAPAPALVSTSTPTAIPVHGHATGPGGSIPTSLASPRTSQQSQATMNSPGSETSKKDKRRSGFFGRIKEKLSKK